LPRLDAAAIAAAATTTAHLRDAADHDADHRALPRAQRRADRAIRDRHDRPRRDDPVGTADRGDRSNRRERHDHRDRPARRRRDGRPKHRRHREDGQESFKCRRCRAFVGPTVSGGRHRNHCPLCLHSRHVDGNRPGDRASDCGSLMAPVGTFHRPKGEQVVLHRCLGCGLERHNRVAADDNPVALLRLPPVPPRVGRPVADPSVAAAEEATG
jgi:hypothetical protein